MTLDEQIAVRQDTPIVRGGKTRARQDCVPPTSRYDSMMNDENRLPQDIQGLVIELMKISVVDMTVERHTVGLVTSFLRAADVRTPDVYRSL